MPWLPFLVATLVGAPSAWANPTVVSVSDEDVIDAVAASGAAGCELSLDAVVGCEAWSQVFGNGYTWTNDVQRIVTSADGARVFILGHSGYPIHGTFVRALDAATGNLVWEQTVGLYGGGGTQFNSIVLSPDGAAVYIGGTRDPDNNFRTGPLRVLSAIAMDAETGMVEWITDWAHPRGVAPNAFLAVDPDGGAVYLAGGALLDCSLGLCVRTAVAAYDAADGTVLYQRVYDHEERLYDWPYGVDIDAAGDALIVAGAQSGVDAFLLALTPDNGDVQWSTSVPLSSTGVAFVVASQPRINDAHGLVHLAVHGGAVVGVSLADGSPAWRDETPATVGAIELSGDGDTLFALDGTLQAFAYSPADGSVRWIHTPESTSRQLAGLAASGPLGGLVLVGCDAVPQGPAVTISVDGDTGQALWTAAYRHELSDPGLLQTNCGTAAHVDVDRGIVYEGGWTRGANASRTNGYHSDAFVNAYAASGPGMDSELVPDFAANCMHKTNGRDKTQCSLEADGTEAQCMTREDPLTTTNCDLSEA